MAKKILNIIEINDDYIKCVKSKPGRLGRVISKVSLEKVSVSDDEQVVKQLAKVFKPKEMRSQEFQLIIPRRFVILKIVRLPASDEAECAQMLALQIGNQVPYPPEMILYDFTIVAKGGDGYSTILVSIIHKDVYSRHVRLCQRLGIRPAVVTFSSVGLLAWMRHFAGRIGLSGERVTLVIHVDQNQSELCFMLGSKLLFSREIKMGLRDAEGERLNKFVNQIQLSARSFERENEVHKIEAIKIISIKNVEACGAMLKEAFHQDVDVYNSTNDLPCEKGLKWPGAIQEGTSITAAAGLTLAKQPPELKFVSTDPKGKNITRIQAQFIKTFALAVAVVLSGIFALSAGYIREAQYLRSVRAKLDAIHSQVDLEQRKMRRLQFADAYLNNRIEVAELFGELYKVTPEDIAYRSISFNTDGELTLQGFAQNRSSINILQAELVNSRYFQDVNLQYASNIRALNKELTDFKILSKLVK